MGCAEALPEWQLQAFSPYGYDLQNGQLTVNQEEARIVRYIYNCVLEGKVTCIIAEEFNTRQIPTKRGGRWQPGTIQHMISNEIFMGDLRMQKTFTTDFLTKKRSKIWVNCPSITLKTIMNQLSPAKHSNRHRWSSSAGNIYAPQAVCVKSIVANTHFPVE